MGAQTFNRYNLFYRLERHKLLHERGAVAKRDDGAAPAPDSEASLFETLARDMPALPSRYQGIQIPKLWFMSSKGSDKKRSHRKSHGVASFTEIARIVANNWREIDQETMNFVTMVSNMLKTFVNERGINAWNSQTQTSKKKKTIKSSPGRRVSDDTGEAKVKETQAPTVSLLSSPSTTLPSPDPASTSTSVSFGLTTELKISCHIKGNGSLGSSLPLRIPDEPSQAQSSSSKKTTKVDDRSKTPQASNRSPAERRQVDSSAGAASALGPVASTSSLTTGSGSDFATNMELSLLQDVLGAGAMSNYYGRGASQQPRQTRSNLLAMVNSMGAGPVQQAMPGSRAPSLPDAPPVPYQRSASMPGPVASGAGDCTVAELERRRRRTAHWQEQRRASSVPSSVASVAGLQRHLYHQQRRSSIDTPGGFTEALEIRRLVHRQHQLSSSWTMGNSDEPKELDIGDDEILAMWSGGNQGQCNRGQR